MSNLSMHDYIISTFNNPGRWVGIAHFVLPYEYICRALSLYESKEIGSPKHYLDTIIHAAFSDWRLDNPGAKYVITDGCMSTFYKMDKDKRKAWLEEFESWFLPQDKVRLQDRMSSWGA